MIRIRRLFIFVVWGTALWASLLIRHAPGDWGHFLCGPWGCGPPLQALAACHLAWLLILLAPTVAVARSRRLSRRAKSRLGAVLCLLSVAIIGAVVVHAHMTALPWGSAMQSGYLWQRSAFALATAVDIPAFQLLACGMLLAWHSRLPSHHAIASDRQSETGPKAQ